MELKIFSRWMLLLFTGSLLILHSCTSKKSEKKEAPAVMSNPVKEAELNTLTLTDKAVQRLGIETSKVISEPVGNSRLFSGEIIAVPGKTITMTAPVAGTLMASGNTIVAGQQVRKGQPLYKLLILPSEKDLLSAQEELSQREVQYNTAIEKLNRSTRMYEEKSGSLRAKQEAEAEVATITAQLRVAKGRVELLSGNPGAATLRLSTLNMLAPISGTILKVYSSSNQVLSTAAPIVDIVTLNPVWVRIPVYAGDEVRIDKTGPAQVRTLSELNGSPNTQTAKRVAGPQTSDPLATSVDLYYELNNGKGDFRPGQKVSATLSYSGTNTALVVPFSAIVYDIQGGTWVYENISPNVYVRRRVELQTVINNKAIILRGIKEGTSVVTVGTAELFGTEFGGGK